MFNKNLILQDNTVVHCSTLAEAKVLLRYFHDIGRTWCSGDSYRHVINYQGEDTCYNIYEGTYTTKHYYESKGYRVLPFKSCLIIGKPKYLKPPKIHKNGNEFLKELERT